MDNDLIELIRKVLPKPSTVPGWKVEPIDRVEDAGIDGASATVRIQRSWRREIFEAGLYRIERNYPLAVETISDETIPILLLSQSLRLYRATTIERVYEYGRFTGELTVGEAYIAQTSDRLGLAAGNDLVSVARRALLAKRSRSRARNMETTTNRLWREQVRELLYCRMVNRSGNDMSHHISIEPFRTLLPIRSLKTLELHGGRSAPLLAIEKESVGACLEISNNQLATLQYELDIAIDAIQKAMSPRQDSRDHALAFEFSAEDLAALENISNN